MRLSQIYALKKGTHKLYVSNQEFELYVTESRSGKYFCLYQDEHAETIEIDQNQSSERVIILKIFRNSLEFTRKVKEHEIMLIN